MKKSVFIQITLTFMFWGLVIFVLLPRACSSDIAAQDSANALYKLQYNDNQKDNQNDY